MKTSSGSRRLLFALIFSTGLFMLSETGPTWAQGPNTVSSFALYSGTIVDVARNVVYVMSDRGGIAKVDLATGRELWHSTDAAKPLAVGTVTQQLIGQVQPVPNAKHLAVAVLNAETGHALTKPDGSPMKAAISLPPGVKPIITESLASQFSASARLMDGGVVVTWRSTGRPARGLPPGVERKLQPTETKIASSELKGHEPSASSGSVLVDFTTGNVSPVNTPAIPKEAALTGGTSVTKWRPIEVTGADRIPRFEGPQFYSVDKRHILVRSNPNTDRNGLIHFVIFDRATKQQVARFTSHDAVMPFLFTGNLIIYESKPARVPSAAGLDEQPAMVQARDAEGKVVWRYKIRDIHRETSPP